MSFSCSPLSGNWCAPAMLPNVSKRSSAYYQATLATCVVTALFAPLTAVANAFILAAVWKNPSLRTPSYVLLAGLAFTDFCTGLITQPFFVALRLGDGVINKHKYFITGLAADGVRYYFLSLTFFVITMIAVERWLHMSRRSLLTVRRVISIYIMFAVFLILVAAGTLYTRYIQSEAFNVIAAFCVLVGVLCIAVTVFAYFKVFRIIQHHQNQVQVNGNALDMKKYKRSFFTILYILAVFVLSYVPSLCVILAFHAFSNHTTPYYVASEVCAAVVLSSSLINPLLYYWRIKEIRDTVKRIIRKLLCKQNGDGSGQF